MFLQQVIVARILFLGLAFGTEVAQMPYICKKCRSEITEELTLSDVFINNPPT